MMVLQMTIYDIAKLAGVSPRTVTRAFQKNSRISEKTRELILRISKENGYHPNALAGRLCGKTLHMVAVSIGSLEIFMGHIRKGFADAGEALKNYKTEVSILHFPDMESFVREVPMFLRSGFDCMALACSEVIPKDTVTLFKEAEIPIMTVTAGYENPSEDDFWLGDVSVDTEMKGRLAGNLLSLIRPEGKFGIFTGDLQTTHHRSCLKGFREEADGAKSITVWDTKDIPAFAAKSAEDCMQEAEPYDGIFFASANSVPAIERFLEIGYHPAVIASDIFPQMSRYLRDGVVQATVYQDPEEQGRLAVTSLYTWLVDGIPPQKQMKVMPRLVLKADLSEFEKDEKENETVIV